MEIFDITLPILYVSMMVAFTATIINWRYIKERPEWIFLPFMAYSVLSEVISNIVKRVYGLETASLSNVLIVITNILLFHWFFRYVKSKPIYYFSVAFTIIAFIANSFYENFFTKTFYYANFVVTILILINVYKLLESIILDDHLLVFKSLPHFWITIGVVIYQINLTVIFLLLIKIVKMDTITFYSILTTMSVILYSSITYGTFLSRGK